MASGFNAGFATGDLKWWAAALITMFAAIFFSVYLQGKGFLGMLPILLGAVIGYVCAIPLGLVTSLWSQQSFGFPNSTFPVFNDPLT